MLKYRILSITVLRLAQALRSYDHANHHTNHLYHIRCDSIHHVGDRVITFLLICAGVFALQFCIVLYKVLHGIDLDN